MNSMLIHNIPADSLNDLAHLFAVYTPRGWSVPAWVDALYVAAGLPQWPYTHYVGIDRD